MASTDRNIIRANTDGAKTEVVYGTSDDDFGYGDWGTAITHDNEHGHAKGKLGVKVIFQGGGCEIQWAHGDRHTDEHSLDGYVNINADTGMLSFPFWSVDKGGNQRVPFWAEFTNTGLKVYTYEGQPPDDEREQWLCFDSNTID